MKVTIDCTVEEFEKIHAAVNFNRVYMKASVAHTKNSIPGYRHAFYLEILKNNPETSKLGYYLERQGSKTKMEKADVK